MENRIKAFRKAYRLTQQKCAERIGVKQPFLSNVERGKCGMTVETAIKLARLLETSVDELFIIKEDEPWTT